MSRKVVLATVITLASAGSIVLTVLAFRESTDLGLVALSGWILLQKATDPGMRPTWGGVLTIALIPLVILAFRASVDIGLASIILHAILNELLDPRGRLARWDKWHGTCAVVGVVTVTLAFRTSTPLGVTAVVVLVAVWVRLAPALPPPRCGLCSVAFGSMAGRYARRVEGVRTVMCGRCKGRLEATNVIR